MKIQQIGTRGIIFTFLELNDCPTNVYVIVGKNNFFICDTFLGPDCMEEVKRHLRSRFKEKPFIVFNSHYHWDHVWGNCAFSESLIIAHEACRKTMIKEGTSELEKYRELRMGEVELTFPNLTFKDSIHFPDEGLLFFHSPGHTKDSSSCFDEMEKTLFVGDNIEAPIPYLEYDDLGEYIKTLNKYLNMNPKAFVSGHGPVLDQSLIHKNMEYIESFIAGDTRKYETGDCEAIHSMNLKIQKEIK